MALNVYLNFKGNCREAVEFYAQVFGAEQPQFMTFGDSPPSPDFTLPEEAKNLIMHTFIHISGRKVMFSDVFPNMPFVVGNNVSLTLNSHNMDELQSAFDQLKEGGTVAMDLQETFWSKGYGSLTDKFGIVWQFNLDPEDEECGTK
ncbi:VOC family protein [Paenibacillus sp. 481]|uniref:VOC family protein n=1 Tax=Paenibacillus sp. 481 TaxID=2835869 RepID=UPI001E3BBEDE|nr:glyoxalase/bleomycin resistance/extradiol dioxygenase family protein [Paenibacillus sp. 481]UHA72633.1 glyoxalase/bleomycin resistance/extradiol dioxygenase family protein [Paenibacillus sp. 481]